MADRMMEQREEMRNQIGRRLAKSCRSTSRIYFVKAARGAPVAQGRASRYNIRMNKELKIRKIGNSAGVVLPKELLAHLDAEIGEALSVSKTRHGIELSAREAEFEDQAAVACEIMARRKRALRELAATEEELTGAIMRDDREILRSLAKR